MSKKIVVACSVIAFSAVAYAVSQTLLASGIGVATAPIATATPDVDPGVASAALKMDATLSSVQLAFKSGSALLDDSARAELDRIASAAREADAHEIHGKEPRQGNFERARSLAFNRAFAARMYLSEQGVDPKRGRIKFHTLGADLTPGVEVIIPDASKTLVSGVASGETESRLTANVSDGYVADLMPSLLRGYLPLGTLRYRVV